MRTFIVGDVHGCLEELDALLAQVELRRGVDRVIFVGDLVAKGPDSLGVLRRARELSALSVRGNHEARVLAFRHGRIEPRKNVSEHRQIALKLSEDDVAYLEATPFFARLPEHAALVVHAGFDPLVPLETQDPEVLMNIRSLKPDGSPSKRVEDGLPWAARYRDRELVLYGHDAIRGLQLRTNSVGLDSGCVYGGELTAIELPARRLHAVPAKATHCVPATRKSLVKLPVCHLSELEPGRARMVEIGVSAAGEPEQAIVTLDAAGQLHAYRNRCRHLPIPLQLGRHGEAHVHDGAFLVCDTHGAKYRLEDGFCVQGPCAGSWLEPLRVRAEDDAVVLHLAFGE